MLDRYCSQAAYDKLWQEKSKEYTQSSLDSTPLLESMIDYLHQINGSSVFEGGSGSGYHAIRMAQAGFFVTAVEYSHAALVMFKKNIQKEGITSERIKTFLGDFMEYLINSEPSCFNAVYLNSILHTFSEEQRHEAYNLVSRSLSNKGIFAVSFKSINDGLYRYATKSLETVSGKIADDIDTANYGITRLFVSNPDPIIQEIANYGLKIQGKPKYWNVSGYDSGGKYGDSSFIGFIFIKE